jgi:hypothetical protein
MVSILDSETAKTPAGGPAPAPRASGTALWVILLLVVFAGGLGYLAYAQRATHRALAAQADPLAEANKRVAKLEARVVTLEGESAKFRAQAEIYAERLGLTQAELAKTETLAKKFRDEQTQGLGSLTGEIGQVKEQIEAHRKAL